MQKEIIHSKDAPSPIGPYSQAVKTGNLVFISGQVAMDPQTGELKTGNVTEETMQVMRNLETVLKAAGIGFENVVKTTIFLKDMGLFATVNEAYGSFFKKDFPARETVAVKGLPRDVNVEISMIATI